MQMYIAHNCIWEKKIQSNDVLERVEWVGGSFLNTYEDTVFLELWLGYTRMLGHALCHLCFPSIVSCDHDSIPKAKLPSKKENEKKQKQTFTVLHLTPFDQSASLMRDYICGLSANL